MLCDKEAPCKLKWSLLVIICAPEGGVRYSFYSVRKLWTISSSRGLKDCKMRQGKNAMHVLDRGERTSDARISCFHSVRCGHAYSQQPKSAYISASTRLCSLWPGVCRLSSTREWSLWYLVETRAAVLLAFSCFWPARWSNEGVARTIIHVGGGHSGHSSSNRRA